MRVEKLELKHLAPYLPYKLSINCDFCDGDILACELEVLSSSEAFLDGCDWDYINNKDFKPILRPLSNLIIFVSHSVLDHLIGVDIYKDKLTYIELSYLLQNHFDVFGLIESGLAVDINTLR